MFAQKQQKLWQLLERWEPRLVATEIGPGVPVQLWTELAAIFREPNRPRGTAHCHIPAAGPPPGTAGRASAPASPDAGAVVIGLINNMPDSALEGTEQQFRRLIGAAAETLADFVRIDRLQHDIDQRKLAVADRLQSAGQRGAQPARRLG